MMYSKCIRWLACVILCWIALLGVTNGFSNPVSLGPSALRTPTCSRAIQEKQHSPGTAVDSATERSNGLLVLATVPFAWGTFEPAVRFVYAIDPPIPAFLFSSAYYLVAATALLTLAITSRPTKDWPIQGGVELGFYLFLGNALQVLGLKTVDSDRAAFLLQLTTIFVPLMEAFLAQNIAAVSSRTWLACAVALLGVGVMRLDNEPLSLSSLAGLLESLAGHWSSGDLYIVAAAIAYTFHCIRLEGYAKSTSAIQLAASKASAETVLSTASAIALVQVSQSLGTDTDGSLASFTRTSGHEIIGFLESLSTEISSGSLPASVLFPAAVAVIWTGLVTCAYTIYAQSYGQSRVRPVTANLIYTIQPVCTALVAYMLLGESLGPAGYLGGALIGSAVVLVSTESAETES